MGKGDELNIFKVQRSINQSKNYIRFQVNNCNDKMCTFKKVFIY